MCTFRFACASRRAVSDVGASAVGAPHFDRTCAGTFTAPFAAPSSARVHGLARS
jgi:hypothetical protein